MAEKFEAPKVGDQVNYVAPGTLKVTKAKITAVDEKTEGRLITAEGVGKVTHRPKDKLAGNTWHLALLAALLTLAITVFAGIPTYHTFSNYGAAANPATVVLPADPNSQIRIVSINYMSDTNKAVMSISSGTTAYSLLATNATSASITNAITSTNGLSANAILILQHAANGVNYTNYAVSWGNTGTNGYSATNGWFMTNAVTTYGTASTGQAGMQSTNINFVVLGTGGWGVIGLPGDEMYVMGTVSSIAVGAGTNVWLNGDDVYSGSYGRPVLVQISPANVSNSIPIISAHYDSASQP